MKRAVLLAVLALSLPTPAFAASAFDVSGDVVVSKVDTESWPQVTMEVAPPRLAPAVLNADAFTVTENDEIRPATVTQLPNSALQVALVLDPSVPADVFRDAQGAALDFLLRLPLGTRVALVSAGKPARVTLESTLDLGAATTAVGDLSPQPGRSIYDALRRADAELLPSDQTRRAILVFGGGKDTSSSTSVNVVERQLRSSGTRLYSVELANGGGGDTMSSIAAEAGGQSIKAASTELVGAYQRVADVLLNQYRVTFQASSRGRARVGIRVAADGFSGESSLSVLLSARPTSSSANQVATSERGGGRAVAEPLAAGLTIVIALLAGAVLITLGHAGLRSTAGYPPAARRER